jgi:hypothetical protein
MEHNRLPLYSFPDIAYVTDELIAEADELFEKAIAASDGRSKQYLEKEYLSILFMKAARLPLDNPEREGLIDQLYESVKKFGIAEIRERTHLENTFENLRTTRYARGRNGEYNLYYVMR